MLLDVPFTHWVVYSEKPLARAGCHCDATKTHAVGHAVYLVKPDWKAMARR